MPVAPIFTSSETQAKSTTTTMKERIFSPQTRLMTRVAPWRRWLSRHAFILFGCAAAVLYAPAPLFICAILAGFFTAVPERFVLVLLASGLTAIAFVAQGTSFWLVLVGYALLWPFRRHIMSDSAVSSMLLAGGSLLLWELWGALQAGGTEPFAMLARVSLSAMLGYFYLQILDRLQNQPQLKPNYRLSLMLLFVYPMFLGLGTLTVFGLTVRFIVVTVCVWLLSFTQDTTWGALAGLLGGLALWHDPFSGFYWSSAFGLLAALIGFTSEFGRISSLLVFASGLVTINGYLIAQGGRGFLPESLVAMLIVSMISDRWLHKWQNQAKALTFRRQPRFNMRTGERLALKRLHGTIELLDEMAAFFQPPISPGQPTDGQSHGIALLLQERCCKPCLKFKSCLARSNDLFEAVAMSKLRPGEIDAQTKAFLHQMTDFCYRPEMMLQEATHLADLYRMNDYWLNNWNENNTLLNHQLHFAAEMLRPIVQERTEKPLAKTSQLRYRLDFERRQSPIFDQTICGDSVLCSEIGNYGVLVISDGMGSGASANHESKSAVRMLERMLHLNYQPEQAMRTINAMLLARSAGERFATLDVLVVDLNSGEGDIYKSGAAPGFLVRDGLVHEISGSGLPAGALPELAVEKRRLPLRESDLIVMISDGMLAVGDERGPSVLLAETLERAKDDPLQKVAERLMLVSEGDGFQEMHDDRTVIAARLRKR